ncbi:Ku protein [Streptomyces sp. NPDC056501]|uniref:Ku protein n=1 Tax=Streptomyces sp. NPDC056501 TaxID=3345841 RepID=UPI0036C52726
MPAPRPVARGRPGALPSPQGPTCPEPTGCFQVSVPYSRSRFCATNASPVLPPSGHSACPSAFLPLATLSNTRVPCSPARSSPEVLARPYVMLRQALDRTEKVAGAKFALRGRGHLALLRPLGGALLLSGLHWVTRSASPPSSRTTRWRARSR